MKNLLLAVVSCLLYVSSAQAQARLSVNCEAAEDVGLFGPVKSYRIETAEISALNGDEIEKLTSAREIILGDGQEVKESIFYDGNGAVKQITKYVYAEHDFIEAITYDANGKEIERTKKAPAISALLEIEEPVISTKAKYEQRPDCSVIKKTYYNDDQPVFVARLTIKRGDNIPRGEGVR